MLNKSGWNVHSIKAEIFEIYSGFAFWQQKRSSGPGCMEMEWQPLFPVRGQTPDRISIGLAKPKQPALAWVMWLMTQLGISVDSWGGAWRRKIPRCPALTHSGQERERDKSI